LLPRHSRIRLGTPNFKIIRRKERDFIRSNAELRPRL